MNPVCPGFMPHHVKPNRCRRCFRDTHDHDVNVATTFTIPLPRRRRESVSSAEQVDASASFTVDTSGRRVRQRSASTSSWFQERKPTESDTSNREKIESLFRNSVDSQKDDEEQRGPASSAVTKTTANGTATRVSTESKSEEKKTSDFIKPVVTRAPTESKSEEKKTSDFVKPVVSKDDKQESNQKLTPRTVPSNPESVAETSKSNFAKPSEVKLRSAKFSKETVDVPPPKIPPKTTTDFRSMLKKVDKPSTTDSSNPEQAKVSPKPSTVKKPVTSRWRETRNEDIQPTKTDTPKPTETKISSVASKFEQPKPTSVVETKKPVLSRFSTFKKEEPPVAVKVVATPKSVTVAQQKPKPPPSSSSSEEESESEEESSEEEEEEPVKKPAPPKDEVPEVAFVVKLKQPPSTVTPDAKAKEDQKQLQQDQDAKIKELQKKCTNLTAELKKCEECCSKLQRDKSDMQKKQQQLLDKDKEALEKTASELSKMRTKLGDMQASQDQVKEEDRKLKTELDKSKKDIEKLKQELDVSKKEMSKTCQELEKAKLEIKKKEMPQHHTSPFSIQQQQQQQQDLKSKQTIEQLKLKLQQTEALCQELMEENEDIKKEVRDLEQELEELHDNFREDQASEFRGLKKELETATKNCRVLQFKLRKAEKRCEQLELERHSLEDKVREFQSSVRSDADKGRAKELENELKMSRKLTATLNEEISSLKEELQKSQAENESLQRQHQKGTTRRSLTPTRQSSRLSPVASREGMTTPVGKDYDSLTRELYDTMERENDLREQFKFSEEEAKTARRKMNALEQENETLMLQMKKLNTLLRARTTTKKGEKDEDEEDLESAENLKLQLEMQDQEMAVLRRKVEDLEKENETLQSEVKYLQEKIISQPLIKVSDILEGDPSSSSPAGSAYWEKKARLLDHELRDSRTKTLEKEREIERLRTEVEIYRKKASKMMVRSRSLDGDLQVDLKRQLQLVEQEASILRQKVSTMETETEKLTTENKRLNLRLSKKPPLSSAEVAQLDIMELQQRNDELQRKISDLKQELVEKSGKDENPVAILQEYKPRRESLTDNESDLIASLKKKLKALEEEHSAQQNKFMHLEIEHNRLTREYKRLKDGLNTKKKPLRVIRDSATRNELREIVNELQDEISELQVTLRGREVTHENLEQELERSRKEAKDVVQEANRKEEKIKVELQKIQRERDALQKEAETHKKRASNAEEHLGQVSGQLSADQLELSKMLGKLQEDLRESERKCKAAEEALEKKTRRLRETQEKLNTVTSLKEDLVRTNRLLESQKSDIAKELEDHRELLSKAESRITDLRNQMDHSDRDVTALRKECNQLRNELEDERTRFKQVSSRTSSEASSIQQVSSQHQQQLSLVSKDRDDLRRVNSELRNRIESLQQQITHNEQIWIEKESRLRDDHKKKKDTAVREAREKGEAALELAREEEKILRNKAQELTDKLEKAETSIKESQEKLRSANTQHRRDRESLQSSIDDLESQKRAEIKKRERAERESEQQLKNKGEELIQSRERLVQLEREQRRLQVQVQEAEEAKQKSQILERDVDRIKKEYDDLTTKYEQLENEFVKTKSRLVQDKEQAETQSCCLQRDLNNLNAEFTSLKEKFTNKHETWKRENTELQERLKGSEQRLERLKNVEQERLRLRSQLEEKETLIESYRKEEKHLKEERDKLRKSVEEMSRASEAQRQAWITSISSSAAEAGGGKATRELGALRADYEGRMSIMASEITSMQKQIAQLATERDNLKSKLSTAERSAEELKSGSLKRERARHREEADLARRKVKEIRNQLEEVKEQLEDSILENRNLKLQIETDRNSADIHISELKSKINQLEEQKILETTRGQTRSLARTRLELAWEKERGELQHLVSETQKLVEDLKVRTESAAKNNEKDKQNLRRQLNYVREMAEKEQHENRRKMAELHSSLLDMRESQAKLRGLYDRMKREREILMSEREEWRHRLHVTQELHDIMQQLQKDVDVVASVRESPSSNSVTVSAEWKESLSNVRQKCEQIQKITSEFKEDERLRRTTSFRRAVSAQEMNRPTNQDPSQRWMQPQRVTNYPLAPPSMILRPPPRQKSLHRKSLSLDHTLGRANSAELLKIWESEGESVGSTPAGSLLSLRLGGYESDSSFADSEYKYGGSLQEHRMPRRYLQTPDSEFGGASSREGSVGGTSCESVPAAIHNQQKKATLKDKFKLLRRTKSIDVSPSGVEAGKKDKEESLRSKISKALRKPISRSQSDVHAPALPPRKLTPEAAPKRPTAEKPLSTSRGDLSTERPLSKKSTTTTSSSKSGRETPV